MKKRQAIAARPRQAIRSAALLGLVAVASGSAAFAARTLDALDELAFLADGSMSVARPVMHTQPLIEAAEAQPSAQPVAIQEEVAEEETPTAIYPLGTKFFGVTPVRAVRTITMIVTAYTPGPESCAPFADGYTATMNSVETNNMAFVAADTSKLPFGTMLSIPGYHSEQVVPVLDRGGAIKGARLDVIFPTVPEAMEWGVREVEVTIYEPIEPIGPTDERG